MPSQPIGLTRRQLIQAFSMAAASAGLAGIPFFKGETSKAYAATGHTVRIGVIAPSHCAMTMIHAHLAGLYAKNGINAELKYLPTSKDIAQQLAQGSLDIGQLITPIFYGVHLGIGPFANYKQDLVSAQVAGSNGGVLVVHWNSPIRNAKDLKGATVGVHSPFMTHNLIINRLLRTHGIDPAKDVNIKVVPMPKMINALNKGEIDAFINPEPLGTFALEKAVGKELLVTKRLWPNHPCCLIAMRREYFEQDIKMSKAAYRATMESGLLLNSFKTRMDSIDLTRLQSPPYRKIPLETVIKAFVPGRSDFAPFPYQSSARAVLIMMWEAGLVPKSIDIEAAVHQTFLSDLSRELLTELGAKPPANNDRKEMIVGKLVG